MLTDMEIIDLHVADVGRRQNKLKTIKNDYRIANVVAITGAGVLTSPIKHLKTPLSLF